MPFAQIGDIQTRYDLTGENGPVLVLSNSLGTNFSMWDPQMAELARSFRILRYDTRGHGQTSVTAGDYTIEQLGSDVLALLDHLQLERIHFCGLSMGGIIGLWLGVHAPDRLHKLIVSNTAAKIGTAEMWNARIATVRKDGMKEVAAAVIQRWFTPEFRATSPDQIARAQAMLEASPPAGYAACCAAIRDIDLRDAVSSIRVPTLVSGGSKDPVTSMADAQYLTERIPGSVLAELNAAHLSNVEQAGAFTNAVADFLSRKGMHNG
ncbi:MAG: 3-oxoadipate enol-lactonase [Acidobacteria bacterium]|nr:3-oxoadipate enol-lactonase [Acidobacteriota bacterium]